MGLKLNGISYDETNNYGNQWGLRIHGFMDFMEMMVNGLGELSANGRTEKCLYK